MTSENFCRKEHAWHYVQVGELLIGLLRAFKDIRRAGACVSVSKYRSSHQVKKMTGYILSLHLRT